MGQTLSQQYLELVRSVPCVLCKLLALLQPRPTAAHHPRDGVGLAQRSGDFCTIALCYDCHQSPLGIHGDRTFMRMAKCTEWDLHDLTNEAVFKLVIAEAAALA